MKDAIGYKVTVSAIVRRCETVGKEWARTTAEAAAPYAYTPEIEKIVQKEIQIFEQCVDVLDMSALVAVINNLPKP